MRQNKNLMLSQAGMLLAAGIVLPFITAHGFGIPGTVLLPMHIPVLLCGYLCGPVYGSILGFVLPVLSSMLTGMPVLFPMVPIMTMELCTYGLTVGLLHHKTKLGKCRYGMYLTLLTAMICGRIMYGLTFHFLTMFAGELKAATVWTAIITGVPGIAIQLLFVPPIVKAVLCYPEAKQKKAVRAARSQIGEEKAACIVIKEGRIVQSETGRGVAPILRLYEGGVLEGAHVVDKVVGKAAAMVMTHAGVKSCYAMTISRPALEWFKQCGIDVEYDICAEYIVNRSGDGMCPMEKTVIDLKDDTQVVTILKNKLQELQQSHM